MFQVSRVFNGSRADRQSLIHLHRLCLQRRALTSQPQNSDRFGHQACHARVISQLQRHIASPPPLTNFLIVDALRSSYPDHTLVQTEESTGILKLAKAGLLEAHLDRSIDYYGYRCKDQDESKSSQSIVLGYSLEFGRYNCSWKGQDFYLYAANWSPYQYSTISSHYILCRNQSQDDRDRQLQFIDDLLVAAYEHSCEVQEEIWIYDDGYWRRNSALWKSIKDCSWDDIILNQDLKQELMNDVSRFFDREKYYASFGVPWKVSLFALI